MSGDAQGKVSVLPFPCNEKFTAMKGKTYNGHCGCVTSMCMTSDDGYMISICADSPTILVWRTRGMDEKVRGFEFWASEQAAGRGSVSETHYTANEASQRASSKPAEWITGEYQSRFVIERKATVAGTRDASRAAWLSEIREPDWYRDSSLALSDQPQKAPSCNLSMEWVHGFRSRGYDGVKYTKDGDLAFFAGATAVVQQAPSSKNGGIAKQVFHTGHDGSDVLCIAVSPDGRTAATGEAGVKPKVILWDLMSGTTRKVIESASDVGALHVGTSKTVGGIGLVEFSSD